MKYYYEKRAYGRAYLPLKHHITVISYEECSPAIRPATGIDIACGGILIETKHRYSIGSKLTLIMHLPINENDKYLKMEAVVVRVKKLPYGNFETGLGFFSDILPGDQNHILQYVYYHRRTAM